MQLQARKIDWNIIPNDIRPYVSSTQTFLTPGKIYTAYAILVYDKVLAALVMDDLENFLFEPVWLFEVISHDIPKDWICNLMVNDNVELILGPDFVARDFQSYKSIVNKEPEPLRQLWRQVLKNRENNE